MTYMIEGTWIGYRPGQDRIVHREYSSNAKFVERVRAIGYGIRYTDGTTLILSVTEAPRRGRKPAINGYTSLIRDCASLGVNSVVALAEARKAATLTPGEPHA